MSLILGVIVILSKDTSKVIISIAVVSNFVNVKKTFKAKKYLFSSVMGDKMLS